MGFLHSLLLNRDKNNHPFRCSYKLLDQHNTMRFLHSLLLNRDRNNHPFHYNYKLLGQHNTMHFHHNLFWNRDKSNLPFHCSYKLLGQCNREDYRHNLHENHTLHFCRLFVQDTNKYLLNQYYMLGLYLEGKILLSKNQNSRDFLLQIYKIPFFQNYKPQGLRSTRHYHHNLLWNHDKYKNQPHCNYMQ